MKTSQNLEELGVGTANAILGALALVIGVAGWWDKLRVFRNVDIPATFLLFAACAWLTLSARQRSSADSAFFGLLAAAIGAASALSALLLDRLHPWVF